MLKLVSKYKFIENRLRLKNKSGFTLIELLAVITIIAFLGVIVGNSITSSIQDVRKESSDTQQKNIISAAKNWGAENIYSLPSNGGSIVLSLHDLMAEGYISGDKENQIVDTSKGQPFSKLRTIVTITNQDGAYKYSLKVEHGKDNINLNAPIVILKGQKEETVTGSYTDPGVLAYNNKGAEITNIQKKIQDHNGVVVGSITGRGTYTITYTATDSNGSTSITRKVIVK